MQPAGDLNGGGNNRSGHQAQAKNDNWILEGNSFLILGREISSVKKLMIKRILNGVT